MPRDFAGAGRRSNARRAPPPARRRRGSAFHPGSFGAGVALGIAFTLAGALLPQWWRDGATKTQPPAPTPDETAPPTHFEFFERLPNDRVSAQPAASPAAAVTVTPAPSGKGDFLLQAGSFTNASDADKLRATLQSQGLNTATTTVTLSNGVVRHRVIVGPFNTSAETQRALTQLRAQNIEALVLARPAAG
jgi:cell division protein FtsN